MNMMISGEPPDDISENCRLLYPGEQSLPLTSEGVRAFKRESRAGDHLDRLIGEGTLLTGLKAGTLAHMRGEWLVEEDGSLFVKVPGGKTECEVSPGRRGRTRAGGGSPCKDCRRLRNGYWSLNGTLQPRRVPVPENDFTSFLKGFFKAHDRVCTPGTVNHRVKEIGKKAGFEKRISVSNLRMTFGKILAEKGFRGDVLRRVMGFPDTNQGKRNAQRYFMLSEEHQNPPYQCNAPTVSVECCKENVHFPGQHCYNHN